MISDITPAHYDVILATNLHYVDWLSPLTKPDLIDLIRVSSYARQIGNGLGALIGFTACGEAAQKNGTKRVRYYEKLVL